MGILIAKNWWSVVIRGLVAILLGIITFAWPGITVGALVLLFGAYAFIDGIVNLAGAWRASRTHERWAASILEGIVGIIAAVVTIFWPAITAFALVYVIAAWALLTGVLEIAAAIRLRRHIAGELFLLLTGIFSILFGIFSFAVPLAGAIAIAYAVGIYLFVFGVLLVVLGVRLRRHWTHTLLGGTGSSVPLTAQ